MLDIQKDKVAVATKAAAMILGHAIEGVQDNAKRIELIRRMIDDFRFGSAYSSRTGRTEPTVTVS